MIHYLLQTVAFQLLFLLAYDLFLKKETFFNWNRWYLLGTSALSLVLPFIQIAAISEQISPELRVQLPAVIVGGEGFVPVVPGPEAFVFPWALLWQGGMLLMGLWFGYKLLKILSLIRKGQSTKLKDFILVILPGSNSAFSFFKTIFLGDSLAPKQREMILLHEQVHVKERHTFDQLFFELLRIVFWFNPLVYMYQRRMTTLQEFIADSKVAQIQGKSAYYQELLSQVFQTENVSFINTFFNHSLIKKRINMLQRSRSSRSKLLKFTLVLPLLAMMVVYTSCSEEQPVADEVVEGKSSEADVMTKIEELSEAIMAKGNLTEEEAKALQFLATPAKEGDKIYTSIHEYLDDTQNIVVEGHEVHYEELEVPYAAVDQVPIFPGCEGMSDAEGRACFQQSMAQYVIENFDIDKLKQEGLTTGRHRIATMFTIEVDGTIKDIKVRSAFEPLSFEAKRTLESLPRLTPGQKDGQPVAVLYSLPILFDTGE